jgi:hypothetical protein
MARHTAPGPDCRLRQIPSRAHPDQPRPRHLCRHDRRMDPRPDWYSGATHRLHRGDHLVTLHQRRTRCPRNRRPDA